MKRVVLSIAILICVNTLLAQDKKAFSINRPKNSINIVFLGDASIMSINYERIFFIDSPFFLAS